MIDSASGVAAQEGRNCHIEDFCWGNVHSLSREGWTGVPLVFYGDVTSANPDPLPRIPRARALLFGFVHAGRRWSAGLRSAAALGVPGALVVASGHPELALFVTFGAFAVLYGEGRVYRVRAWVVLTAGAGLLGAAAVGGLVGELLPGRDGFTLVVEIGLLTAIAMGGVFVIDATRLGPPGALFFVLVCAGALVASASGTGIGAILWCTLLGVLGSVAASMAGAMVDPSKPERLAVDAAVKAVQEYADAIAAGGATLAARHRAGEAVANGWAAIHDAGVPTRAARSPHMVAMTAAHRALAAADSDPIEELPEGMIPLARPPLSYRLSRALSVHSHACTTSVRVGVACLVAGGLGSLVAASHPHWAILAALIVLQAGPDRVGGRVRATQRLIGTVLGLGLFAVLYELSPTGYALVAVVAALQFGIELFVTRNYAIAAVFITPVALLAGDASAGDIGVVVGNRLAETLIGVVVAVLALHFVLAKADRRNLMWTEQRMRSAARALLAALRLSPVDQAPLALRRDLHYELIGGMRSGIDAAHNDPGWTHRHWPAHAALLRSGYDLLAACWAAPAGERLDDIGRWDEEFRPSHEPESDTRTA